MDVEGTTFTNGIEKDVPAPGDNNRYPPAGLGMILVPAMPGFTSPEAASKLEALACCSCSCWKLEMSVGLSKMYGCGCIMLEGVGRRTMGLVPVAAVPVRMDEW